LAECTADDDTTSVCGDSGAIFLPWTKKQSPHPVVDKEKNGDRIATNGSYFIACYEPSFYGGNNYMPLFYAVFDLPNRNPD